MNVVTIAGRLTRDAETRNLNNGKSVTGFSIAVQESKDNTIFLDCEQWDCKIEQYLKKGGFIVVNGRLKQEEYEKDGQKIRRLKIIANQITLGGKTEGASEQPQTKTNTKSVAQNHTLPHNDLPF